jgi:enoyl-CoA hydratase/carnithine racemase
MASRLALVKLYSRILTETRRGNLCAISEIDYHDAQKSKLYEQMEVETAIIADMSRTADAREGIASFLGKRAPKFSGK